LKSELPATVIQGKKSLIAIRYDDKAAFDVHMSSQKVKDAGSWLQREGVLDSSNPPSLAMLNYLPTMQFTRDEVLSHDDPHVLFAELDYVPGGIETSTPYWQAVVDTGRDFESGTLSYGIAKDQEKENRLVAFEVYESPAYLRDVHVPSDAIQNSIANTKHLRTGLKHHMLKKVGGFLHKYQAQ
jgi:quinol monooxygenase YgiN